MADAKSFWNAASDDQRLAVLPFAEWKKYATSNGFIDKDTDARDVQSLWKSASGNNWFNLDGELKRIVETTLQRTGKLAATPIRPAPKMQGEAGRA